MISYFLKLLLNVSIKINLISFSVQIFRGSQLFSHLRPGLGNGLVFMNGKSYVLGSPTCDCLNEEFQLKGDNPVPSVGPLMMSASKFKAIL